MYYKIILFSSFFWAIASFTSSSFAMESDDVDVHCTSPAKKIPTEDLRVKKIRILQRALSDCDQFIAFEEDFLETCQNQNQFDISFEGILHNIEAIRRVKSFLINYNKKGKDEEFLLSSFLELRLLHLISRRTVILDSRSQDEQRQKGLPLNAPSIFYGPTKPELFHELSPVHQLFARTSTDRYQFFNQMILHVWQLVDPRTLHPKTKLKIRASTTLWDNLTGKRDYLGHPDEAIGKYIGEEFPYEKDCVNYDDHIAEDEVKDIPLLGWGGKGRYISTYQTLYTRSLWDQTLPEYKKIKELPYPEWLKPLPNKDVVDITQKPIIPPPVQKAPKMPRFKSPIQVIEVPTVAEEKQEPIVESPLPQILEISRPISPVPVKIDTPVALKEEPEDKIAAPVVNENENAKVITTLPSEPLRPRGMRLFHNESASSQQNTKVSPLKGSHQLVHQQIFDQQQFKKVTYGQFKALWKHICGPQSVVESTGSSHKKLIAPNNEVFGTFAHSDSMTYSHRTIGYIRDALTQIGHGN